MTGGEATDMEQLAGYSPFEPRCTKHPDYHAIKRPRANCETCWMMWFDKNNQFWVID